MANLTESAVYEPGIYQLETTDPVLGGATGPANVQAKQLANRTAWLKAKVDGLGLNGDAATYAGNMNSLTATGFYFITTGASNRPESLPVPGLCIVIASGSAPRYVRQLWIGANVWYRALFLDASPVIGNWERLQNDTGLTGSVTAFAANTAPIGWLKANGAAVSRTSYADLFAIIGTTYGAGNGTTTFNLPDLRGEFVRGWDDGRGVDTGRIFGSAQSDEFKTHHHQLRKINSGGGSLNGYDFGGASPVTGSSGASGSDNIEDFGGDETRPRNIALLYCIKY